jgi:hypothetical protein
MKDVIKGRKRTEIKSPFYREAVQEFAPLRDRTGTDFPESVSITDVLHFEEMPDGEREVAVNVHQHTEERRGRREI